MNNMICRKLRSRKGKKYFYCAKQRIEIPLEEVPVKKKAAIGVRGMKMNAKDHLQQVHLLTLNGDDIAYYKEKEVHLNRLRISKRDAKAVKTRV